MLGQTLQAVVIRAYTMGISEERGATYLARITAFPRRMIWGGGVDYLEIYVGTV